MKDLVLSQNAKQYFINALKGIGLPKIGSNRDCSEAEIANFLDNPDMSTVDLYGIIRFSIANQFRVDAAAGEKYLQKKTAYDRQTVKSVFEGIFNVTGEQLNDDECNTYLRNLTASGISEDGEMTTATMHALHLDLVVEKVLDTLFKGVPEQKMFSTNKKELKKKLIYANKDRKEETLNSKIEKIDCDIEEVQTDLLRIKYADFKQFLKDKNKYDAYSFDRWIVDNNSVASYSDYYKKYKNERLKANLLEETSAFFGNEAKAKQFLDTKIIKDDKKDLFKGDLLLRLSANKSLLAESKKFCAERCKAQNIDYSDNELSMWDVMAAAGNYKAQLVTFFQTRAQVQAVEEKENPKKYEVKRENKIGNLMGEKGRDFVKKETGTGAVVDYDISESLKKGGKGPWKGLKPLFEQIEHFLSSTIYKTVQTMGLIARKLFDKYKYSAVLENSKPKEKIEAPDLTENWATEYEPMPKELEGSSEAQKFYNRTKARLLADKARVLRREAEIADNSPKAEECNAHKIYLTERIAVAEEILQNMPKEDSPRYNDKAYYDKLEEQILNAGKDKFNPEREENKYRKQITDMAVENPAAPVLNDPKALAALEEAADKEDERLGKEAAERIKNKGFVDKFLARTKNNSAEKEMVAALSQFEIMVKGTSANMQNAKRKMAAEMFGLSEKVANKEITDQDLDEMIERLFNVSGKVASWKDALLHNKMTVDVVGKEINQFVVNDLQENAKRSTYDEYRVEQYRMGNVEAVNQEMTR